MKSMKASFRSVLLTIILISGFFVSIVSVNAASVVISNVASTNITANGVTVTWITDKPSDSKVLYGLDTNHNSFTPLDSTEVTNHKVNITGLLSGAKYVYSVYSNQPALSGGVAKSSDNIFTTLSAATFVCGARSVMGNTPPYWGDSPAQDVIKSPGSQVGISIKGEDGCAGQTSQFQIYKSDSLVKSIDLSLTQGTAVSGQTGAYILSADWKNDLNDGDYTIKLIKVGTQVFSSNQSGNTLSIQYTGSCKLVGGVWTQGTVLVGQDVSLQATGQGCGGREVSFDIYEKDPTSDDYVRTIKGTIANGNQATTVAYKFTSADYAKGGNESGNEIMYFVAKVGTKGQSDYSETPKSSDLVLKPSVAGSCQLSYAEWKWYFKAQPIVGSPMDMRVTGIGCPNYNVIFHVRESSAGDADVVAATAKFNTQGTEAIGKWIVTGVDDVHIGHYLFYFEAVADQSHARSKDLVIPVNSHNGCLNCNNVGGDLPVGTCECADGSRPGAGPVAGTCQDICKSHIGDAFTNKSPTGGTGGGFGNTTGDGSGAGNGSGSGGNYTAPATATKSYSFSITNPLKGGPNDLFDIINIATKWLLNISIPLAVLFILWAGFLMLTAGPVPANFEKGKKVLTYTVLGLAVIFIGRGFITLIYSVLELGGADTTQSQDSTFTHSAPDGMNCINNLCETSGISCQTYVNCLPVEGLGSTCQGAGSCPNGLTCNNGICQRKDGNGFGEACTGPANCKGGACGMSGGVGTCVDNSSSSSSNSGGSYQDVLNVTAQQITTTKAKVGEALDISLGVSEPISASQLYSWQEIPKNSLPPGLKLRPESTANEGRIDGIPTKAGTYNFKVQAMDISHKQYGQVSLTLTVNP